MLIIRNQQLHQSQQILHLPKKFPMNFLLCNFLYCNQHPPTQLHGLYWHKLQLNSQGMNKLLMNNCKIHSIHKMQPPKFLSPTVFLQLNLIYCHICTTKHYCYLKEIPPDGNQLCQNNSILLMDIPHLIHSLMQHKDMLPLLVNQSSLTFIEHDRLSLPNMNFEEQLMDYMRLCITICIPMTNLGPNY